MDYAEREKLLPEGLDASVYRERFIKSYPFQPEVIDVLYKRWGSFPTFQRTRGVLRLLSLVTYSMKDSKSPFIRLADFNLRNEEIKRELIKHIGAEYDSVIAADITSPDAGAKKVDKSLGDAFVPFYFGTKAATAIFLCSFSGGPEKGATINEVKLSTADPSVPSSIVVEAVSKLRESLFFLQYDGKLFFTNQPNLNRVHLTKKESVKEEDIWAEEKSLLLESLKRNHFESFLWPKFSRDVPDMRKLKLVIQQSQDEERCWEILENCGERPRVYRNTLVFLCPLDSERTNFEGFLRAKLAWQLIEEDESLSLTPEQRKEVKERLRKAEGETRDRLRSLYRVVLLPSKDKLKDLDLGIPTYGAQIALTEEIFQRLRDEGEILERLAPLTVKEKYLKDKDWVETKKILDSLFSTPGEIRIVSDEVLRSCLKEGVQQGMFGLGELEGEQPACHYFKIESFPQLVEGEILIKAELCRPEEEVSEEKFSSYVSLIREAQTADSLEKAVKEIPVSYLSEKQREKLAEEINKRKSEVGPVVVPGEKFRKLGLKLSIPSGKLSDIAKMVSYIRTKFSDVNVRVEISAQNGEISTSDYEDKVKEAIIQSNVKVEEEELR